MATFFLWCGEGSLKPPFRTLIGGLIPKDKASSFNALGSRAKTNFQSRVQKLKNLAFMKWVTLDLRGSSE